MYRAASDHSSGVNDRTNIIARGFKDCSKHSIPGLDDVGRPGSEVESSRKEFEAETHKLDIHILLLTKGDEDIV